MAVILRVHLVGVFLLFILALVGGELSGTGIDVRCKCVCPHGLNATANQTVFIDEIEDESECLCEKVVLPLIVPLVDDKICLKCECQYEIRNTWLIQLIVSVVLSVLILMTSYLILVHPFLYCYCKRRNGNISVSQFNREPNLRSRMELYSLRWRRNIEEQRRRNLS